MAWCSFLEAGVFNSGVVVPFLVKISVKWILI